MLTGKMAFSGETVTDTLAAVIKEEPDWSQLPAATPIRVRVLLQRCLQKDPKQRLQAIGDARISLDEVLSGASDPSLAGATQISALLWKRTLIISLGALLLLVVTALAIWNLKPSPSEEPQPITRMVINLPPGQQLAGLENGPAVAISPDGTHLAYVATQGGTQQLYLRAMDSLEARPIPGTAGVVNPFFSPDGQWVGFFAGGKLKKISVSGGAPLSLGDATSPRGASWNSQGTIVFPPAVVGAPQQVSDEGSAVQPLTQLGRDEVSHRWPDYLPDGKAVLFSASGTISSWINAQVSVQPIGTGERRSLVQGATQPRYAPSGQLVFVQGGNLMAVPFNIERLEVTGAALPVLEGVMESPSSGAAQYDISATGSLVYVPGGDQSNQSTLVWVSRSGAEQPLAAPAHNYRYARLSPDGRQAAVTISEQEAQVWLYNLSRDTLTRLTFDGNMNVIPSWTPDGKRVAFESTKEGPGNIFWQLADGSGGLERLTIGENTEVPCSWSPDGKLLAFVEINPTTGYDIWVLRIGDRKAQPFLRTPFNDSAPEFSPDGRWLVYTSNESGRTEVYVQPYPGPGGKWQISADGGTEPLWNRNGRELFYRSGDKMMAVDISTQPAFVAGKPRILFHGPYVANTPPSSGPFYDVSPDGQRFLMLKSTEQVGAAPTQINVVLNWIEELKRRVPTGTK